MRVRATRDGFYAGSRRRAGSVFTLCDGDKPGKWMAPTDTAATAQPAEPGPTKPEKTAPPNVSVKWNIGIKGYDVWRDGEVVQSFSGDGAKDRADAYAVKLISPDAQQD